MQEAAIQPQSQHRHYVLGVLSLVYVVHHVDRNVLLVLLRTRLLAVLVPIWSVFTALAARRETQRRPQLNQHPEK